MPCSSVTNAIIFGFIFIANFSQLHRFLRYFLPLFCVPKILSTLSLIRIPIIERLFWGHYNVSIVFLLLLNFDRSV